MDIPNLFISNSENVLHQDKAWQRFVFIFCVTMLVLPVLLYSFVLAIDPYDNLPFSLNLERVPVDKMQRLFHPALARKARFDSAIIGNSNIRLLKPAQLNPLLGGQFVNLGMNAASSWEQQKIFDIFARHHQSIKFVIFGLDYLWCDNTYADKKFVGATTEANFPAWMYDEDDYNNFPALNLASLKHSWRQLLAVSDIKPSEYGRDGYTVFTKPMSKYNLTKARIKIYGSAQPVERPPIQPAVTMTHEQRAAIPITALKRLEKMLAQLPSPSTKILFFTPYHHYFQAQSGSSAAIMWEECKRRTVKLAEKFENTHVLDFMIHSEITLNDHHYWDFKHYTVDVAQALGEMIAAAIKNQQQNSNFKLLYRPEK